MFNEIISCMGLIDPSHVTRCYNGVWQRSTGNGILDYSLDTYVTLEAHNRCYTAFPRHMNVNWYYYLPNEVNQSVFVVIPFLGKRLGFRVFLAAEL